MRVNGHCLDFGDSAAEQEAAKYAEVWTSIDKYKDHSPGLENVERFMRVVEPEKGSELIDIGCGAGVAGLEFKKLGLDVWYLDITDAGLEPEVDRGRFIQGPLWSEWRQNKQGRGWKYGFCCDVMEHIPPEYTMLVIDRILAACRTVWFQIALVPDGFGEMIGQPLHLTVRPYVWWLDRIASISKVRDARDLCGAGLYIAER